MKLDLLNDEFEWPVPRRHEFRDVRASELGEYRRKLRESRRVETLAGVSKMAGEVGCSSKERQTQLSSFGRLKARRQSAWSGRERTEIGNAMAVAPWQAADHAPRKW